MNWSILGKIMKINENKHNYYKFSMSRTIYKKLFIYLMTIKHVKIQSKNFIIQHI